MKTRTVSVALAIAALLSTAAGCARSAGAQAAAPASHPVFAYGLPATPAAAPQPAEHLARFEIEVQPPTHIDPAGSPRR